MKNKTKSEYYYLTELGVLKGFKKNSINKSDKIFLVLDSNVCMDIVGIVNRKNISKINKRKAFELIQYSQKKSFQPFVVFALVELSLNKTTYEVDYNKFLDFGTKLRFAFELPIEKLKKNDFSTNFTSPNTEINKDITPIVEEILVFYCALLKIREIAHKGLGKQKSKQNLIQFVEWMNSELGIFLGLEYQLAIQIFGGNNKFNSMIKESSNKGKSIKALWGTAWDLFHARVSRNSNQLSKIVGENINSIFITNDKNLHELLAPQIKFASEYGRTKISITEGEDDYPPHFEDDFMKEMNSTVLKKYENKTFSHPEYPESNLIKKIISDLEKNIA